MLYFKIFSYKVRSLSQEMGLHKLLLLSLASRACSGVMTSVAFVGIPLLSSSFIPSNARHPMKKQCLLVP